MIDWTAGCCKMENELWNKLENYYYWVYGEYTVYAAMHNSVNS